MEGIPCTSDINMSVTEVCLSHCYALSRDEECPEIITTLTRASNSRNLLAHTNVDCPIFSFSLSFQLRDKAVFVSDHSQQNKGTEQKAPTTISALVNSLPQRQTKQQTERMLKAASSRGWAVLAAVSTVLFCVLFQHYLGYAFSFDSSGDVTLSVLHLLLSARKVQQSVTDLKTRDFLNGQHVQITTVYRLVGLVVKASASGAEDPGFKSRLRRDFSGV